MEKINFIKTFTPIILAGTDLVGTKVIEAPTYSGNFSFIFSEIKFTF